MHTTMQCCSNVVMGVPNLPCWSAFQYDAASQRCGAGGAQQVRDPQTSIAAQARAAMAGSPCRRHAFEVVAY